VQTTRFEDQVATLYLQRGHQVEREVKRTENVTDIFIRSSKGEKWIVRCVSLNEVDVSVAYSLIQIMRSEFAQQGSIVTQGTIPTAVEQAVKGKPIHLVDGVKLQEYLNRLQPQAKSNATLAPASLIASSESVPNQAPPQAQATTLKACPYCAEDVQETATVCPFCQKDLTEQPPSPTTNSSAGIQPQKSHKGRLIAVVVIAAILAILYTQVGFYTVQPIGALPGGITLLVWRQSSEPFFNSPDGVCLQRIGGVSLLCRLAAFNAAPVDRIIARLGYWEFAYLQSTGGLIFDR
jgi:hypothetical protein